MSLTLPREVLFMSHPWALRVSVLRNVKRLLKEGAFYNQSINQSLYVVKVKEKNKKKFLIVVD